MENVSCIKTSALSMTLMVYAQDANLGIYSIKGTALLITVKPCLQLTMFVSYARLILSTSAGFATTDLKQIA